MINNMNKAMQTLSLKDPIMKELIAKYGEVSLDGNYMQSRGFYFTDLANSIIGQQLSVKAASTIWERVIKIFGGDITPLKVLETPDENFRNAGLSAPKTGYIKNLAGAVVDGTIEFDRMQELSDEEIIKQLTSVKGIGRWTAEMFLIFSLGRPDVFSAGDVGLKNAINKLYGKIDTEKITQTWKPFRTYASLLLWKSLNNEPKKKI